MTNYTRPLVLFSASFMLCACSTDGMFSDAVSKTPNHEEQVTTHPAPHHHFSKKTHASHKEASQEVGTMSTPMTLEHKGGEDTSLPSTTAAPEPQPATPMPATTTPVAPASATSGPTKPSSQTAVVPKSDTNKTNQTVVPNVAPSLGE